MSCVTLMANRSGWSFQNPAPRRAARGRQTDQQNEARGNPSRPGLHLTPDKQAGYMTATVFQIASAIQPLTRAGSIYAWRREVDSNCRYRSWNTPPTAFSRISQHAEFVSAARILGVLRGTKVEPPAGPSLQIVVADGIQPSIGLAQGPHRDKRF